MTAQDLKNSILQLAMRGKLVEQRMEEGTAKELIEQIKLEKERLIKEGKLRKEKSLPKIAEEEIPFKIPESWEWVRLDDACIYLQRGKSPTYSDIKKIPVIAQKCNQWDSFELEKAQFIVPETLKKYSEERLLQDKDILINSTGLGTLGRNQIYLASNNLYGIAVADSHVTVVRLNSQVLTPEFFFYYWRNPSVQLVIEGQTSGSTKQKELSLATIQRYLVPIPPLAEQKRIIAKIEKIFPYIEKYDKVYTKLKTFNQKFPEDMQKSILQYAMQGKLVEQRPEEGTGEKLYWQIQAEKESLIKEGKIKKEKSLPNIIETEINFDIPKTWKWTRLGNVISLLSGTDFKPENYNDQGIGTVYITGASNLDENGVLISRWTETPRNIVHQGDILLVCKGSGYGKTVICDIKEAHIARQIMSIKKMRNLDMKFIKYYLDANFTYLKSKGQGVIPGIDRNTILNMLFPLPPYKEQKRIVTELEKIMPYFQRLTK